MGIVERKGEDQSGEPVDPSTLPHAMILRKAASVDDVPEFEIVDTEQTGELVYYDFVDWTSIRRLNFDKALEQGNVEHSWAGSKLLVPDRLETTVDELLDAMPVGAGLEGSGAADEESTGETGGSAETVQFDLSDWDHDGRLAIEYALSGRWPIFETAWDGILRAIGANSAVLGAAEATVAHAWKDDKLIVRPSDADQVENLVILVENATRLTLDHDKDRIAYDLAGFGDQHLTDLVRRLAGAGVAHQFTDDDELVVHEEDEEKVEDLFEALSTPDGSGQEGPEDGLTVQEVLSNLFIAADRLKNNGSDPAAALDLVEAAERFGKLALPFGFDDMTWAKLTVAVAGLRDLVDSESAEYEAIEESGAGLRETLRPIV